jgi:glycosyltransferase involved in cell wall biosynthesis
VKLVIQNGSRIWGGNEKWLATLARGLLDGGHQVVVSCPPGEVRTRLEGMGVATSAVRPRGDLDVLSGVAFARWLRRERPDALLLTSWTRQAWAAWAGRRARVPRVVVRLGIVRALPRRGPNALAFRRWVDAMIVNAPEIREAWRRSASFFPQSEVHVVMNGLRARPEARPELRARLRAELGVGEGTLLIGGAGHLAHRKGFDLLLRAFARADLPDARVVVAGGGEHGEELRALARTLGVEARVDWLGHRTDAPDVVAGCDLFVLPSRNEGMANVMLEAMAAGVPVLATDISGVRRALGADPPGGAQAGWIVPTEDAHALADALREAALGPPQERERRAAAAIDRVRERFGVERMVSECETILFGSSGRAARP